MSEHEHPDVTEIRDQILTGNLSRRSVLKRGIALGLSAPVIAGLLAACGGDDDDEDPTATESTDSGQEATPTEEDSGGEDEEATETPEDEEEATEEPEPEATATEEPTDSGGERGGGGRLTILNWQAASILNPHLAQGGKDFSASRIYAETLADFREDGSMVPFLAKEIPSLENGDVAADGSSVTWRLREGVVWHDGEPFTADDVVFTWEYVIDEEAPTTTKSLFDSVESVEAVDDFTVLITFKDPTPAWFEVYTTTAGPIVPKHILQDWMGATANDAPFNQSPIGTGPFKVVEFKPQDTVLYEIHEDYWDPGKPFFDTVEYKGGGDATSAARAVLESGEADFAQNLQVEADILLQMESVGLGRITTALGNSVEKILVNRTDPNEEVDGDRAHFSTAHPANSELEFRRAMTYLTDRDIIAGQLYGPSGDAAVNIIQAPPRFNSPNTSYEFNTDTAAQILDDAGWVLEGGVRTKNGYSANFLYQTSTNSVRQKTQEIVKAAFEEVGIKVELKAVDAGVFFSSDAGNPDTYTHFYTDIEMFTNTGSIYPLRYTSWWKSNEPEEDIPSSANEWSGRNIERFFGTPAAEAYNELWVAANKELDPDKQNELFIGMNDILVEDVVEIPLVWRKAVAGALNSLQGISPSNWSASWYYDIKDWYREE